MINALLALAFTEVISLLLNLLFVVIFRPTRLGWWVLIPVPLSVIFGCRF